MEGLVFTEAEWEEARPRLVKDMTEHLKAYRAPVFRHVGDRAVGHGSGSYLKLADRIFILTNAHVAEARKANSVLVHQFAGRDEFHPVVGDHLEFGPPLDLALLPVDMAKWKGTDHTSRAIEADRIVMFHSPIPTEVMSFVGFPAADVGFTYETVTSKAQCLTGREVALPPEDDRFDGRFHFGLDYVPDLSTDVVAKNGLSLPPGLSGSAVWNTAFVEAKNHGVAWTPELAKVTGVVWGWPSNVGCLVATRAEYLRSFLLGAMAALAVPRPAGLP